MGIIMRQASAWDITSIFGLLQSWDCHWMMIFHHYPIIPHRVRSPKNRLHHSRGRRHVGRRRHSRACRCGRPKGAGRDRACRSSALAWETVNLWFLGTLW